MFRVIDDSGNRVLDYNEFIKGCHDYGIPLSKDEIAEAFKTMDRNQSGSIDFDEFLVALRVRKVVFSFTFMPFSRL